MSIDTFDPVQEARDVTADVLRMIHDRTPILVVDSPPGAGKTTLGIQIAATGSGLLHDSVMVACWTNRQAIDFAARVARAYPKVSVQLFIRENLSLLVPPADAALSNLVLVHKAADVHPGGVTVSNASKWTSAPLAHRYDWLLIDEAYQIPEYRFRRLAVMADRYVLLGDPGQIPPLVQADVSPWGCELDGPHVSCPLAVLQRHPAAPVRRLPVSWRLRPDTVGIVRESFYEFPFASGEGDQPKALRLASPARSGSVLDLLTRPGVSLAAVQLEGELVGTDVDPEVAEYMAETVYSLLERKAQITDDVGSRSLIGSDIGLIASHRAQVAEIDKRLRSKGVATGGDGVVVETTERWQGLERHVMMIHHPLAGLDSLSPFDLDRGRFCVMLTRHKTSCLIVGRKGITEALRNHPHKGDRFSGAPDDEFMGWTAHARVWEELQRLERVVTY